MLSRRNRCLLFVLTPYPAYPIREGSCVAFAFFFLSFSLYLESTRLYLHQLFNYCAGVRFQ